MRENPIRVAIVLGAAVLWLAGLRLFLRSEMSRRKKVGWTSILLLVGVAVGIVLPLDQLWEKFLVLLMILPVLGLLDVWLLGSKRGLSFWIRACGFEVGTVFGAASGARLLLDMAGAAPLIPGAR